MPGWPFARGFLLGIKFDVGGGCEGPALVYELESESFDIGESGLGGVAGLQAFSIKDGSLSSLALLVAFLVECRLVTPSFTDDVVNPLSLRLEIFASFSMFPSSANVASRMLSFWFSSPISSILPL